MKIYKKTNWLILLFLCCAIQIMGQQTVYSAKLYKLLSSMTLEEKVSLCAGGDCGFKGIPRLGISCLGLTDGPRGPNAQVGTTAFPCGVLFGSTWNPSMVEKAGKVMGEETRALGRRVLLGPGLNILRDPLGGRFFEYYTEDPYLNSTIAVADIKGIQSEGVVACAKHFVCNNREDNRNFYMSVVDDRTLHGVAKDSIEAARIAIEGGLDMDMISNIYRDKLVGLVRQNKVSEKLVDEAVERILLVKYDLGLFHNPYLYCDANREKTDVMTSENLQAALESARKSIVLLKNDNHILPLAKSGKTIAVIGEMANSKSDMNGCWATYSRPDDPTTILDGIRAAAPDCKVFYAKGCKVDAKEPEDYSQAMELASRSDVVIMTMGEYGWMSGEGMSRADLDIVGNQLDLFKHLQTLGKPIVVLLTNGRPLVIPYLAEHATAILETWFLGTKAGNAIADVLFGDYNPSGKLTVSFPYCVGQLPLYYSQLPTGRPHYEDVKDPYRSLYRDVTNDALYPFGYGLSYTSFEYSNFRVLNSVMTADKGIDVCVDLKNTGSWEGEEVVQLYIHDLYASVSQPTRLLKRFSKVSLRPSETKTITFHLDRDDVKFYKEKVGWIAEPGIFNIFVGGNSRDLLKASFELK